MTPNCSPWSPGGVLFVGASVSQGYGRVHVGAASRDLERAEDQPVVGNKKFQSTGLAGWETIIAMERSTIFNGKIHYFDWVIFNSYVKLPEGNWWLTYPLKNMKVGLDHHPNYWGK